MQLTIWADPQMSTLHIVQGGIENGDKAWLERAARLNRNAKTWVAPKSARVGDEVVICVLGHGFFATAAMRHRHFASRTDRLILRRTIRHGVQMMGRTILHT